MSEVALFCFRCAGPLRRAEATAELSCVAGGMSLSRRMEEVLLLRFGPHLAPHAPAPDRAAPWYCPGCRSPLVEMQCARCAETLSDLLYQLVELHPHR